MPFFNDTQFQPKRKFRFLVGFSNLGEDLVYMVTKATRPSFELTNITEHKILNHTFKFPGIVKWNDIDITLIDAIDPNVGSRFYNVLRNMGYVQPGTADQLAAGISKHQAWQALGEVVIRQLDAGGQGAPDKADQSLPSSGVLSGAKSHEIWTLKNAFIKSIKWGDVDYSSEDIVTVDVGITYDYATYEPVNPPAGLDYSM